MPSFRVIRYGASALFRSIVLGLYLLACTLNTFDQKLPVRFFSSAEGMASSVIHHVARDSKGFLWFSARGGLSRYDGSQFVNYRIAENAPAPIVNFFLESKDGHYWIATDGGLYRVRIDTQFLPEPVESKSVPGEKDLNATKVSDAGFWALHEDAAGNLWGGGAKLYRIDDREKETVSVTPVEFVDASEAGSYAEIRTFAESPDGSLWFGFSDGAARRLPDGRFIIYRLPRVAKVQQMLSVRVDMAGRVWTSNTSGLFVFKPQAPAELGSIRDRTVMELSVDDVQLGNSGEIEFPDSPGHMLRLTLDQELPGMTSLVFDDLYPDADGRIWLPSQKGLFVFTGNSYRRLHDPLNEIETARRIEKDLAGRLWFGSFVGVFMYSPAGLITYSQHSGLDEPSVHAIQSNDSGELLVVHGNWRVSRLTADGFVTERLDVPVGSTYNWTGQPVLVDRGGGIWGLTTQGLFKRTAGSIVSQLAPPEFGRTDRSFYRAFEQRSGLIWFLVRGSNDVGLLRHDPQNQTWTDVSRLPGYPPNVPASALTESADGTLWLGSYGPGGLYKFTGDRFVSIPTPDSIRARSILGLKFDRRNRLWVASAGGGVLRIDRPDDPDPQFKIYTVADGLSSDNIRCLTEAHDGSMYVGTIRGVSRIEPDTSRIESIDTSDGLAADFVHAAYTRADGSIWFGTGNGVSRLDPTEKSAHALTSVYVSDISVAGTQYRISPFGQRDVSELDLSSGQNNIQIKFSGIGADPAVSYVYRLEGSSNDSWSEPVAHRTLNFANLSPGSYKLFISAVGAAASSPSEPATVTFTIRPPFYRTWWFVSIAVLLALGSVVAVDRYRSAKTREVEHALVKSRESESRFRTLTDTASDAIITIDEESRIVFANESVEKVFGYTPDELTGRMLTMLMPDRMRSVHENGLGRYLKTRSRNISWDAVPLPGLHKSGEEIPLEVSFGEFERGGKRYFTGIARDVSERKRAEADLQRSREERIAELQRVRSRIANDLHDDIGSSLTQISVYSELARQHKRDGKPGGPLDMITNISNELVETMSDIVWAINPKKDHLLDLTQRMRRYAANVLSAKDIEMNFTAPDLDSDLPLGANIRREVFLIFKETVNNIAKHSEANNADITFQLDDDTLTLRFVDDGVGFDVSGRVAEGEPDWKRFRGGNGLANMGRRAEDLGGRYEIESRIGEGTTVRVEIPIETADERRIST